MTAAPEETDRFRIRLEAFLSGAARVEADRRIYRVLLIAGGIVILAAGGSLIFLALLLLYILLDETYYHHHLRMRRRDIADIGRFGFTVLLFHYTLTVLAFAAVPAYGAFAGTKVGLAVTLLLTIGQVLNAISYETRSRDTAVIAAFILAVLFQLCAFGLGLSWALPIHERIFLNIGCALLSIYCTHVLLVTMRTRGDLVKRTEALADATRGETVGRLASGIAHDFNNLLTVMRGNIDLIGEVPEADRPALLHEIADAAERGGKLVRKLLDQNRISADELSLVSLGDFLSTFSTFARRVLPANIDLRAECSDDLIVRIGPHLLEAALLNLVVNARDAMPTGGRIDITARMATPDDDRPADAAFVMIEVSDTGHGMSPDFLVRATDLRATTKPPGAGTGLGLAMVQSFAQQSGGDLFLSSEVGKGTQIRLFLPV